MSVKKVIRDNKEIIIPITHESAILDDNNISIITKIGDLSLLQTKNKNLVDAINEAYKLWL